MSTPVQYVGDAPTVYLTVDAVATEFVAGGPPVHVSDLAATALLERPDFQAPEVVEIPDGDPSTKWTVAQLKAALTADGIPYPASATKTVLLDLFPTDINTAGNGEEE